MLDVNRTFTPSEAAVASGVPLKIVNQEIDQGPLKAARKESGSKRSLKEDDLFYLVIANRLDTRLLQLTAEGKDSVNAAIVTYRRRPVLPFTFVEGQVRAAMVYFGWHSSESHKILRGS